MSSKPVALGAHIYAGGHTVGVRAAGFDVLAHLEEGTFGKETAERNLGVDVIVGDMAANARALMREFGGKVCWLYGNPPCASWSSAGHRVKDKSINLDRWRLDDRTQCTIRVFDLIDVVRPTVFSWECVANATTKGEDFVRGRIEFCHERGYDVTGLVFDAADLGLPSARRRFFFVAHRVAFAPAPVPYRRTTVRDAIGGIEEPGEVEPLRTIRTEILKRMPKGVTGKLADYARVGQKLNGRVYGKPGFLHCRVGWDCQAPTVTGGQHLYHPDEPRPLTVLEQQVLCGYPKTYEFVGKTASRRYAEVACAVTPTAARWLARGVISSLERGEKIGRKRRATLLNFIREGTRYAQSWADMPGGDHGA